MASIMSPSVVFGPLRSSRGFFFKEGRQREVALGRLSIRKTCYRVMCFHNLYCSSKATPVFFFSWMDFHVHASPS
ncbi:PREDICTED: uncharacterized protein LOC104805885 isoform X2 [Tarenaya hassleriana]|uniref:uncharacterized protein LOC104805885 isoform X2 n=1 Tax=Tarenaya hassleriana TaxID=28532 RepID=UPI00053C4BB5|nr:PREDICTED: uncharacterized protein LOC104805885 isoform X2 [Tarenaya hassleriana]